MARRLALAGFGLENVGVHKAIQAARGIVFWLLAAISFCVLALAAVAVWPALIAIARGGYGSVSFFGGASWAVGAAAAYLVLALVVLLRKRWRVPTRPVA